MSSDADLSIVLNLLECPFYSSCSLPKINFLCKIPECKSCSEYNAKLIKIQ
ncbi:MAG: hypothetical protein ACFE94_00955 [Candidatus Hodarchaeota archaeon]